MTPIVKECAEMLIMLLATELELKLEDVLDFKGKAKTAIQKIIIL